MSNCRTVRKLVRPTKAQKEAYKRLVQRDGEKNLTKMELVLLSEHPWLTVSQRERFGQMAQA
jgi:hypothetical protein